MPDSITIKDEPTPALSLEDQAAIQESEKAEQSTSESAELLAGKYKSVEDLEKGYQELQQKLSKGEPTDTAETTETETKTEEEQPETTGDAKEIYGDFQIKFLKQTDQFYLGVQAQTLTELLVLG